MLSDVIYTNTYSTMLRTQGINLSLYSWIVDRIVDDSRQPQGADSPFHLHVLRKLFCVTSMPSSSSLIQMPSHLIENHQYVNQINLLAENTMFMQRLFWKYWRLCCRASAKRTTTANNCFDRHKFKINISQRKWVKANLT